MKLEGAQVGDSIEAKLYRVVKDGKGKRVKTEIVFEDSYEIDEKAAEAQEILIETTIDTIKDIDVAEGQKVTYVWTEEMFADNANPEVDEPKAEHNDLDNEKQTLTVETVEVADKPVDNDDNTDAGSKSTHANCLPQTGNTNSVLATLGLGGLITAAFVWIKRRQ